MRNNQGQNGFFPIQPCGNDPHAMRQINQRCIYSNIRENRFLGWKNYFINQEKSQPVTANDNKRYRIILSQPRFYKRNHFPSGTASLDRVYCILVFFIT